MPAGAARSWKEALSSRWLIGGGVVLLLGLGVAVGRAWYQEYVVREEISRLQTEAKRLEAKKLETLELLKYVTSESYLEQEARTGLNLIKEGETVAVVARSVTSGPPGQLASELVESTRLSNPRRWWRRFVH